MDNKYGGNCVNIFNLLASDEAKGKKVQLGLQEFFIFRFASDTLKIRNTPDRCAEKIQDMKNVCIFN